MQESVECCAYAVTRTNLLCRVPRIFQDESSNGERVIFRSRDVVVKFGGDLLLILFSIRCIECFVSNPLFTAVVLHDLLRCIPSVSQCIETFDDTMGQLSL